MLYKYIVLFRKYLEKEYNKYLDIYYHEEIFKSKHNKLENIIYIGILETLNEDFIITKNLSNIIGR